MHDLIRLYAIVCGEQHDSETDQHAALERVTQHYLDLAQQATLAVHPTEIRRIAGPVRVHTPAAAIAWVEAEYPNLVATAYRAAESHRPDLALRLLAALYRPLANRGHSSDRIALNRLAIRTAQHIGDRRAEAQAWEDLGTLSAQVDATADADSHNERALAIWTELDDRTGQQACLAALGNSCRQRGRDNEAVHYLERSLEISRELGHTGGEASALNYLGLTLLGAGRAERAISCLARSATLYRGLGNRLGEAIALANRGWVHQRSGDPEQAIGYHERSLTMFHELGDVYNEAEQHWGLGQAHHLLGHPPQARTHWTRAITASRDIRILDEETSARLLTQDVPDTPEIIRLNT